MPLAAIIDDSMLIASAAVAPPASTCSVDSAHNLPHWLVRNRDELGADPAQHAGKNASNPYGKLSAFNATEDGQQHAPLPAFLQSKQPEESPRQVQHFAPHERLYGLLQHSGARGSYSGHSEGPAVQHRCSSSQLARSTFHSIATSTVHPQLPLSEPALLQSLCAPRQPSSSSFTVPLHELPGSALQKQWPAEQVHAAAQLPALTDVSVKELQQRFTSLNSMNLSAGTSAQELARALEHYALVLKNMNPAVEGTARDTPKASSPFMLEPSVLKHGSALAPGVVAKAVAASSAALHSAAHNSGGGQVGAHDPVCKRKPPVADAWADADAYMPPRSSGSMQNSQLSASRGDQRSHPQHVLGMYSAARSPQLEKDNHHTAAKMQLLTEALRPLLQQVVETSGTELDQMLSHHGELPQNMVLEWLIQQCTHGPSRSIEGRTAGSPHIPSYHASQPSCSLAEVGYGSSAAVSRRVLPNSTLQQPTSMSMELASGHDHSACADVQLHKGLELLNGSANRTEHTGPGASKRLCVRPMMQLDAPDSMQMPRLELGLGVSGFPSFSRPLAFQSGKQSHGKDGFAPQEWERAVNGVPGTSPDQSADGWQDSSPTSAGRKPKRPCHYPGCNKHSQQNTDGHQLYCIAHMRECGMQPRRQFCAHDGCSKEVVTSLDGQRLFCKSHMREHGLMPRYRQCQHEDCSKQVKTSSDGQRLYCKSHMREHGMKPKYKPCQHPGCENRAEPCTAGQHTFCKSHMRQRGLEPKYK